MMTTSVNPVRVPSTALIKFVFLILAYAAVFYFGAGAFVDKLAAYIGRPQIPHSHFPWVFVAPNTIALAVTAWMLRRRWIDLRPPQLFVAGAAMAIASIPIWLAVVLGFNAVFNFATMSQATWRIVLTLMLLISGVLTAQVLRLRRPSI